MKGSCVSEATLGSCGSTRPVIRSQAGSATPDEAEAGRSRSLLPPAADVRCERRGSAGSRHGATYARHPGTRRVDADPSPLDPLAELVALRWSDVDLAVGVVRIERGVVNGPDGLVEKDTKTHAARRVALDNRTVEIVR